MYFTLLFLSIIIYFFIFISNPNLTSNSLLTWVESMILLTSNSAQPITCKETSPRVDNWLEFCTQILA